MRVRMRTIFAHPVHGVAHPGQEIDLPPAMAEDLTERGFADPVIAAAQARAPEAVTASPEETEVQAPPRESRARKKD
jgi:hypothetical protein